MVYHSDHKLLNQRLLPTRCQFEYINIEYTEYKDWVIGSTVVPVHAMGKQGQIKTVLFLTRLDQYQSAKGTNWL